MVDLKAARKAVGLRQGRLAQVLGVTQGAVSQWELGKTHPSRKVLIKLADTLGITLEELCSEEDDDTDSCDD